MGSVVVVHALSCPAAGGILIPLPGIKLMSPALKADSQPLDQGSPTSRLLHPTEGHTVECRASDCSEEPAGPISLFAVEEETVSHRWEG